ncbi:ribosome-binding protein aMBF1 (putative translation factor) [Halarchaeum rubridurum]|uniref:Ribosome-binding protein aMBF1 (Putative translation factor) n=1 Tax=Halarchaeum rubridurum TaxID=489911 RepID=A0A830FXP4_9EURY|nr:multiprotein-bridging factor 1 family protein [Halarchaeum rubridurum]MBP1953676.1 ribosome-binding protein aMBF1 (putative translation factor) [Halarchaeum rubridurum]GGM53793.1 transcriptional regulator [Halarchaeum rubridurum]
MAKYSTGGSSGGGGGGTCELCGTSTDSLTTASVAGAELTVCQNCADLDESKKRSRRNANADSGGSSSGSSGGSERERNSAVRTAAKQIDATRGDSSHWEEHGTNYERDRLPYLVSGYGEIVEEARQSEGLQLAELAEELDVDENDLLAVEQGRATQAGVGGSIVRALEERLDVTLVSE